MDNFQGTIQTLIKNRTLDFGYSQTPVFVTDATIQIAPEGSCFYAVRPFGADATVTFAWDINGVVVSALTGTSIKAASALMDRFSAIKFSDPADGKFVQLYTMRLGMSTVVAGLIAPVVSGDDGLGGAISTTNGSFTGGSLVYTYAWYLDAVLLPAYTDNHIAATPSAGDYTCIVTATNVHGSASQTSNAFTVS